MLLPCRAVGSKSEVVRPLYAMRHGLLHKSARCHRGEYGGGSTLLKEFFSFIKVTIQNTCSLLIAAAIKSSLSVNSRGDLEVLRATQFMLTVASFQFLGKLINTLILTFAKFGQKVVRL